jgi:hypothetical protein
MNLKYIKSQTNEMRLDHVVRDGGTLEFVPEQIE